MPVERDVSFVSPSGVRLQCDIHLPPGAGPWPGLITIHGGGWIVGDRSWYEEEATFFASQGYVVFNASYRLAPLHPFPAAVADIQSLVRFARASARAEPGLAAFGNSAGGHLAAMAALCPVPFDGGPAEGFRVDGFVGVSPITELPLPDDPFFPVAKQFLEQFMGCAHAEGPERWASAGPMRYADASVPGLLIHGDRDDIVSVEQSRRLHAAMNGGAELVVMPGEGHQFTYEAWTEIRRLSLEWLARLFG